VTSFTQKKQLVSYLFVLWGQTKSVCEGLPFEYNNKPAINDFDRMMKHAMSQLNEEQKKIIMKEFVEKNCPNWYLEYYSRSSFYRHKHQSMDTFIRCLHGRKMLK
jgi:hypothetical protein